MERPESLHASLRRRTAEVHASLEAEVAERRYFASLPGYAEYLRRFLSIQAGAERWLSACGAERYIEDWPRRQRAHQVRNDLIALGFEQPSDEASLTLEKRIEHVLGVAYVLEGSTLGGAFLLKSVAVLGISPGHGASFLASYGANRAQMWRAFLKTLATWDDRDISHDAVVHAACATFETARHWLTQASRPLSAATRAQPPASL